jgi:N-acetylglucosamine-6-phosphate deacetylase
MEQFVLATKEMSTEVIADGHHLSDELLRFAYTMKGSDRLCLVTDSSRALDAPPGRYRFGNRDDGEWFLHQGGVGRTLDGTGLASSASGMDHMIRIMARATKAPLFEIVKMASLTPARLTGLDSERGSLAKGKLADVVVLNKKMHPRHVIIQGHPFR